MRLCTFPEQSFEFLLNKYFLTTNFLMIKFYLFKTFVLLFLLLSANPVWAQTRVTGKVTSSEDGTGLRGVSILEKGTSNGTATDVEGNYSITTGQIQK
jgi:hypothetical protein